MEAKIYLAGDLDETSRLIATHRLTPYTLDVDNSKPSFQSSVSSAISGFFVFADNLNSLLTAGIPLPYIDAPYGVQDTLQTNYAAAEIMGNPEGFNTFSSTKNRIIEFMIKLFGEDEKGAKDAHNHFYALQSLCVPWLDNTLGVVHPPPKVHLAVGDKVYSTGYINGLTTTHFDPIAELTLANGEKTRVIQLSEILISMTSQALTGLAMPYGNRSGFSPGNFIAYGGLHAQ